MATAIATRWISFFVTPDITISDKDPRSTGAQVLQFCRDHNAALQTVIPERRQRLGSTERRNRNFKDANRPIIDGGEMKMRVVKTGENTHLCGCI